MVTVLAIHINTLYLMVTATLKGALPEQWAVNVVITQPRAATGVSDAQVAHLLA